MILPLDTLNTMVGLGAVLMEAGALAIFVSLYFRSRNQTALELSNLIWRWGLWLGLLLTLFALGISLYYSEVLGFAPCGLCWLMRVFMYSQVVLFAVALWKNDRGVADYIIALSIAGLLVGLYQHYLQLGGADLLPCPAVPGEADCGDKILFEFGHVTLPWVGVSMFLVLIATALHLRKKI